MMWMRKRRRKKRHEEVNNSFLTLKHFRSAPLVKVAGALSYPPFITICQVNSSSAFVTVTDVILDVTAHTKEPTHTKTQTETHTQRQTQKMPVLCCSLFCSEPSLII